MDKKQSVKKILSLLLCLCFLLELLPAMPAVAAAGEMTSDGITVKTADTLAEVPDSFAGSVLEYEVVDSEKEIIAVRVYAKNALIAVFAYSIAYDSELLVPCTASGTRLTNPSTYATSAVVFPKLGDIGVLTDAGMAKTYKKSKKTKKLRDQPSNSTEDTVATGLWLKSGTVSETGTIACSYNQQSSIIDDGSANHTATRSFYNCIAENSIDTRGREPLELFSVYFMPVQDKSLEDVSGDTIKMCTWELEESDTGSKISDGKLDDTILTDAYFVGFPALRHVAKVNVQKTAADTAALAGGADVTIQKVIRDGAGGETPDGDALSYTAEANDGRLWQNGAVAYYGGVEGAIGLTAGDYKYTVTPKTDEGEENTGYFTVPESSSASQLDVTLYAKAKGAKAYTLTLKDGETGAAFAAGTLAQVRLGGGAQTDAVLPAGGSLALDAVSGDTGDLVITVPGYVTRTLKDLSFTDDGISYNGGSLTELTLEAVKTTVSVPLPAGQTLTAKQGDTVVGTVTGKAGAANGELRLVDGSYTFAIGEKSWPVEIDTQPDKTGTAGKNQVLYDGTAIAFQGGGLRGSLHLSGDGSTGLTGGANLVYGTAKNGDGSPRVDIYDDTGLNFQWRVKDQTVSGINGQTLDADTVAKILADYKQGSDVKFTLAATAGAYTDPVSADLKLGGTASSEKVTLAGKVKLAWAPGSKTKMVATVTGLPSEDVPALLKYTWYFSSQNGTTYLPDVVTASRTDTLNLNDHDIASLLEKGDVTVYVYLSAYAEDKYYIWDVDSLTLQNSQYTATVNGEVQLRLSEDGKSVIADASGVEPAQTAEKPYQYAWTVHHGGKTEVLPALGATAALPDDLTQPATVTVRVTVDGYSGAAVGSLDLENKTPLTGSVALSHNVRVLKATVSGAQADADLVYSWYAGGALIGATTSNTYDADALLGAYSDVKDVIFRVVVSDGSGNHSGTLTDTDSLKGAYLEPVSTGRKNISGYLTVTETGGVYSAALDHVTPTDKHSLFENDLSYTWSVNGRPVGGGQTLSKADIQDYIDNASGDLTLVVNATVKASNAQYTGTVSGTAIVPGADNKDQTLFDADVSLSWNVGETILTAKVENANDASGVTYKWFADGVEVAGQTGKSLHLSAVPGLEDKLKTADAVIRVEVSPKDTTAYYGSVSASRTVAKAEEFRPTLSGTVTVSAEDLAEGGKRFTADVSALLPETLREEPGLNHLRYVWTVNGEIQAGESVVVNNGLNLTADQLPESGSIQVTVTAYKHDGSVVGVKNLTDGAKTGLAGLLGISNDKGTLTAEATELKDGSGTPVSESDLHYQWLVDGAIIPGATGKTLSAATTSGILAAYPTAHIAQFTVLASADGYPDSLQATENLAGQKKTTEKKAIALGGTVQIVPQEGSEGVYTVDLSGITSEEGVAEDVTKVKENLVYTWSTPDGNSWTGKTFDTAKIQSLLENTSTEDFVPLRVLVTVDPNADSPYYGTFSDSQGVAGTGTGESKTLVTGSIDFTIMETADGLKDGLKAAVNFTAPEGGYTGDLVYSWTVDGDPVTPDPDDPARLPHAALLPALNRGKSSVVVSLSAAVPADAEDYYGTITGSFTLTPETESLSSGNYSIPLTGTVTITNPDGDGHLVAEVNGENWGGTDPMNFKFTWTVRGQLLPVWSGVGANTYDYSRAFTDQKRGDPVGAYVEAKATNPFYRGYLTFSADYTISDALRDYAGVKLTAPNSVLTATVSELPDKTLDKDTKLSYAWYVDNTLIEGADKNTLNMRDYEQFWGTWGSSKVNVRVEVKDTREKNAYTGSITSNLSVNKIGFLEGTVTITRSGTTFTATLGEDFVAHPDVDKADLIYTWVKNDVVRLPDTGPSVTLDAAPEGTMVKVVVSAPLHLDGKLEALYMVSLPIAPIPEGLLYRMPTTPGGNDGMIIVPTGEDYIYGASATDEGTRVTPTKTADGKFAITGLAAGSYYVGVAGTSEYKPSGRVMVTLRDAPIPVTTDSTDKQVTLSCTGDSYALGQTVTASFTGHGKTLEDSGFTATYPDGIDEDWYKAQILRHEWDWDVTDGSLTYNLSGMERNDSYWLRQSAEVGWQLKVAAELSYPFSGSFPAELSDPIVKGAQEEAPTEAEVEADKRSITVKSVDGKADPKVLQNYEFRLDGGAWQSAATFTGLEPASTHKVEIRHIETEYKDASEPLEINDVNTKPRDSIGGTVVITAPTLSEGDPWKGGVTLRADISALTPEEARTEETAADLIYTWYLDNAPQAATGNTFTLPASVNNQKLHSLYLEVTVTDPASDFTGRVKTVTYNVGDLVKSQPAPTGLGGQSPSGPTRTDGRITVPENTYFREDGTTAIYQYRKAGTGSSLWRDLTGDTGLAVGSYEVRFAGYKKTEDGVEYTYNPSNPTTVDVEYLMLEGTVKLVGKDGSKPGKKPGFITIGESFDVELDITTKGMEDCEAFTYTLYSSYSSSFDDAEPVTGAEDVALSVIQAQQTRATADGNYSDNGRTFWVVASTTAAAKDANGKLYHGQLRSDPLKCVLKDARPLTSVLGAASKVTENGQEVVNATLYNLDGRLRYEYQWIGPIDSFATEAEAKANIRTQEMGGHVQELYDQVPAGSSAVDVRKNSAGEGGEGWYAVRLMETYDTYASEPQILKIYLKPLECTVHILNESGESQQGDSLLVEVTGLDDEDSARTYQWKAKAPGSNDFVPINGGVGDVWMPGPEFVDYTVIVELMVAGYSNAVESDNQVLITRKTRAVSDIPVTDYHRTSTADASDGYITIDPKTMTLEDGTVYTEKFEYSADNGQTWQEVTGKQASSNKWLIDNLPVGKYLVRLAQNPEFKASEPVEVDVAWKVIKAAAEMQSVPTQDFLNNKVPHRDNDICTSVDTLRLLEIEAGSEFTVPGTVIASNLAQNLKIVDEDGYIVPKTEYNVLGWLYQDDAGTWQTVSGSNIQNILDLNGKGFSAGDKLVYRVEAKPDSKFCGYADVAVTLAKQSQAAPLNPNFRSPSTKEKAEDPATADGAIMNLVAEAGLPAAGALGFQFRVFGESEWLTPGSAEALARFPMSRLEGTTIAGLPAARYEVRRMGNEEFDFSPPVEIEVKYQPLRGSVSISSSPSFVFGGTLRATVTLSAAAEGATFTYEWHRVDGTGDVVVGGNTNSYKTTASDILAYFYVVATGNDNWGEALTSEQVQVLKRDQAAPSLGKKDVAIDHSVLGSITGLSTGKAYEWMKQGGSWQRVNGVSTIDNLSEGVYLVRLAQTDTDNASPETTVIISVDGQQDLGGSLQLIKIMGGGSTLSITGNTTTPYDNGATLQVDLSKLTLPGGAVVDPATGTVTTPPQKTLPEGTAENVEYAEDAPERIDVTTDLVEASPKTGNLKYQWYRDGTAIAGATGDSYKLTVLDIGHKISVTVSLDTVVVVSGFTEQKIEKQAEWEEEITPAKAVWVLNPAYQPKPDPEPEPPEGGGEEGGEESGGSASSGAREQTWDTLPDDQEEGLDGEMKYIQKTIPAVTVTHPAVYVYKYVREVTGYGGNVSSPTVNVTNSSQAAPQPLIGVSPKTPSGSDGMIIIPAGGEAADYEYRASGRVDEVLKIAPEDLVELTVDAALLERIAKADQAKLDGVKTVYAIPGLTVNSYDVRYAALLGMDASPYTERVEVSYVQPPARQITGKVLLSGDPTVYQTLTATPDADVPAAAWAEATITWCRDGGVIVDENNKPVTGTSYKLTPDDVGHMISVQVVGAYEVGKWDSGVYGGGTADSDGNYTIPLESDQFGLVKKLPGRGAPALDFYVTEDGYFVVITGWVEDNVDNEGNPIPTTMRQYEMMIDGKDTMFSDANEGIIKGKMSIDLEDGETIIRVREKETADRYKSAEKVIQVDDQGGVVIVDASKITLKGAFTFEEGDTDYLPQTLTYLQQNVTQAANGYTYTLTAPLTGDENYLTMGVFNGSTELLSVKLSTTAETVSWENVEFQLKSAADSKCVEYAISGLNPGEYSLEIHKFHHSPAAVTGITAAGSEEGGVVERSNATVMHLYAGDMNDDGLINEDDLFLARINYGRKALWGFASKTEIVDSGVLAAVQRSVLAGVAAQTAPWTMGEYTVPAAQQASIPDRRDETAVRNAFEMLFNKVYKTDEYGAYVDAAGNALEEGKYWKTNDAGEYVDAAGKVLGDNYYKTDALGNYVDADGNVLFDQTSVLGRVDLRVDLRVLQQTAIPAGFNGLKLEWEPQQKDGAAVLNYRYKLNVYAVGTEPMYAADLRMKFPANLTLENAETDSALDVVSKSEQASVAPTEGSKGTPGELYLTGLLTGQTGTVKLATYTFTINVNDVGRLSVNDFAMNMVPVDTLTGKADEAQLLAMGGIYTGSAITGELAGGLNGVKVYMDGFPYDFKVDDGKTKVEGDYLLVMDPGRKETPIRLDEVQKNTGNPPHVFKPVDSEEWLLGQAKRDFVEDLVYEWFIFDVKTDAAGEILRDASGKPIPVPGTEERVDESYLLDEGRAFRPDADMIGKGVKVRITASKQSMYSYYALHTGSEIIEDWMVNDNDLYVKGDPVKYDTGLGQLVRLDEAPEGHSLRRASRAARAEDTVNTANLDLEYAAITDRVLNAALEANLEATGQKIVDGQVPVNGTDVLFSDAIEGLSFTRFPRTAPSETGTTLPGDTADVPEGWYFVRYAEDAVAGIYAGTDIKAVKVEPYQPTKITFDLSIEGEPRVGARLTAKPSNPQTLDPGQSTVNYSYQWYRVSNGEYITIEGANRSFYTTTTADLGMELRVTVQAGGYYTSDPISRNTAKIEKNISADVPAMPATKTTHNSVTVTPDASETRAIQYSIDGGLNWVDWNPGDGPVRFTGLEKETPYTVNYRYKETDETIYTETRNVGATTKAAPKSTIEGTVHIQGEHAMDGTLLMGGTVTAILDSIRPNIDPDEADSAPELKNEDLLYTWYVADVTLDGDGNPLKDGAGNIIFTGKTQVQSGKTKADGGDKLALTGDWAGKYVIVEVTHMDYSGVIDDNDGALKRRSSTENPADVKIQYRTDTSILVIPPEGDYEYALADADGNPISAWQTSETFTGLTPETEYHIIQRIRQNAVYEPSRPSRPVTVTTLRAGEKQLVVTVLDEKTGEPISGAKVTVVIQEAILEGDVEKTLSGLSNSAGTASILGEDDIQMDFATYPIIVERSGYVTLETTVAIRDALTFVSYQLTPETKEDPKPPTPGGNQGGTTDDGHHKAHGPYFYGYPDGTIRPKDDITRAEATAAVVRLFGLYKDVRPGSSSGSSKQYSDVDPNQWYAPYIACAEDYGLVKGYPDGTFHPNDAITRAEFISMVVKMMGADKGPGSGRFSDIKGGEWYSEAVMQADYIGIIEGYPDGTFKPQNRITREEVAVILNRAADREPIEADIDLYLSEHTVRLPADFVKRTGWAFYNLFEAYVGCEWTDELFRKR